MVKVQAAFSGFSVRDLKAARDFYGGTMGIGVEEEKMGLKLVLPGDVRVFVYLKMDHQPANFTIMNFVVEDIDKAVSELEDKDVSFERYDVPEMPQDDKGILRGLSMHMGPDIAWFKDPSGNILSIMQEK